MKNKFGFDHNRSKPVAKYSLDGELLATYGSFSEAERKTKISKSTIRSSIHGRTKSIYPYVWKFA